MKVCGGCFFERIGVMNKGYFTNGERALWLSSAALVCTTFFLWGDGDLLHLSASLIGVTSLILNAKGNPIGQLLMIVRKILEKNGLTLTEEASDHLSTYISAMKKANTYGLASARTMKYISNMIYDKYLFRMSQSPDSPVNQIILDDVDEFVWKEAPRKTIGF